MKGKPTLAGDGLNLHGPQSSSVRDGDRSAAIHALTLTPFFPSADNEVSGCFIHEPIVRLAQVGVVSTVLGVNPVYRARKQTIPSAPVEWVRYLQVPGNLGLAGSGRFLYTALLRKAIRLHRERPINIIHAHGALPCGLAATLLSRQLNTPYVVTVHGLDVFNDQFGDRFSARWRRRRSIDVYRAAHSVVCISGKVQQILRAGMQRDVRSAVVYNGTDTEMFSPAPGKQDSQQQYLLAVGNLIPSKGQELVLRAIPRLESAFPRLRCRLIGEGPDRSRLESLSRELGTDQRVQFLGRQSRTEVATAMRACSVFVLPSRSEGLGCVYLEAMACGKAVIACRGQGIEEIIEHGRTGWLISDGLDKLVHALSTLLQLDDVRLQMGLAARETILNGYTLSHQVQALEGIYREAIERS